MTSEKPSERFADLRRHVSVLGRCEWLAWTLEELLGYREIRQVFADAATEENPFLAVARHFNLEINLDRFFETIPGQGPVVVVANHAFGGADALALSAGLCEARKDFRILANREVTLLDGVAERVFPVSLLDPASRGSNPASLRATLKHVKAGGALGVFPAGRVAYWRGDRMQDPPWNEHVIRLLQRMDALVVPLWFHGNPPAWINFTSRLSGFVRTALIPTGLVRMRGGTIEASVGEPFRSTLLTQLGPDAGGWLRRRVEGLAKRGN